MISKYAYSKLIYCSRILYLSYTCRLTECYHRCIALGATCASALIESSARQINCAWLTCGLAAICLLRLITVNRLDRQLDNHNIWNCCTIHYHHCALTIRDRWVAHARVFFIMSCTILPSYLLPISIVLIHSLPAGTIQNLLAENKQWAKNSADGFSWRRWSHHHVADTPARLSLN